MTTQPINLEENPEDYTDVLFRLLGSDNIDQVRYANSGGFEYELRKTGGSSNLGVSIVLPQDYITFSLNIGIGKDGFELTIDHLDGGTYA